MLSDITDLFASFVHFLANNGTASVLLALVLIGLTFAWLWAVEKAIRLEISTETGVEMKHLGLGPSYSASARTMIYIGAIHLFLNLSASMVRFWSDNWGDGFEDALVYGPQGFLLDAIGLGSLAPLPYLAALPLALMAYGFLFSAIFYATATRDLSPKPSPIWWLKPLYVVPFIYFVLPFRLWRERSKKKAKDKEGKEGKEEDTAGDEAGEGESAGALEATPESASKEVEAPEAPSQPLPYVPFTSSDGLNPIQEVNDSRDGGVHLQGHVTVQRWDFEDGLPGTAIEGRLFRFLPRYEWMIRSWVMPALLVAMLAAVSGLLSAPPAGEPKIKLEGGFPAYNKDVETSELTSILPPPLPYTEAQLAALQAMVGVALPVEPSLSADGAESPEATDTADPPSEKAQDQEPAEGSEEPLTGDGDKPDSEDSVDADPSEEDKPDAPEDKPDAPEDKPDASEEDSPVSRVLAVASKLAEGKSLKLKASEKYDCADASTSDYAQVIALAEARGEEGLAARLTLNAGLCDPEAISGDWEHFTEEKKLCEFLKEACRFVKRSWNRVRHGEDAETTAMRLARIKKAAERIDDDDEELAARALLIAAMIHAAHPGYQRQATALFSRYTRDASHADADANTQLLGFNATLLQAHLLIRFHRFEVAEKLLRGTWGVAEKKLTDLQNGSLERDPDYADKTPEEKRALQGLWLLKGLHYGYLLETLWKPEDAREHYKELTELTAELEHGNLLAKARERYAWTDPVQTNPKNPTHNTYLAKQIYFFGPMYASTMAALLLFLIGLKRSLRSPSIARNRKEPEVIEPAPEPEAPRPTRVPWEEIETGLTGGPRPMCALSDPVELVHGVWDVLSEEETHRHEEMSRLEAVTEDMSAEKKRLARLEKQLAREKKRPARKPTPMRSRRLSVTSKSPRRAWQSLSNPWRDPRKAPRPLRLQDQAKPRRLEAQAQRSPMTALCRRSWALEAA